MGEEKTCKCICCKYGKGNIVSYFLTPAKIILCFLLIFILILSITSMSFADVNLPPKPPKIIVGGDYSYPPYEFLDKKGQPAGYNVELTRAIAQVMQMDIEIKLDNWSYIKKQAEDGKIDLLQGLFYSQTRAQNFIFSTPHKIVHFNIFIRKDEPLIKSVQDLKGKQIIVQKGDVMHDYVIENNLDEKITLAETPADVMRLLSSGKAQCALLAKATGLYWGRKLNLNNIVTAGVAIETRPYCFATLKSNKPLIDQISQGLEILRQTGRYQQIYDKWLASLEPERFSAKIVFEYAVIILFIFLLILIFILLRSIHLKKKIKTKTSQLQQEELGRTRAEFALRMSEQCFRAIADYTYFWELWVSPKGKVLWTNPAVTRITGYTIEDIMNMKDFPINIVSDEHKRKARKAFESALKGSTATGVQFKLCRKDGTVIWAEASWQPIYDDHGIPQGTRTSICDITDRKQAEQRIKHLNAVLYAIRDVNQLIVREKHTQNLIDGVCDILIKARGYHNIWIVLVDQKQQFVTAAQAGIGKKFDEFAENLKKGKKPKFFTTALNSKKLLYIEDMSSECPDCPFVEFYRDVGVVTMRLQNTSTVYGVVTISMDNKHINDQEELELFKDFASDISFALHMIELEKNRHAAKKALEESEIRFRDIVLNTSDIAWEIDRTGRYVYCSENVTSCLGYKASELMGKTPFDLMEHFEQLKVKDAIKDLFKKRQPLIDLENWVLTKDNRKICLLTNGVPVFNSDGDFIGYRGVDKDITDWKIAEQRIKQTEQRFRKYFELGLIGMAITSPDKGWLEVNQSLCDMLGYSREELLQKNWLEMTYSEDISREMQQFLQLRDGQIEGYTIEKRFVRKDGQIIDTILSVKSILKTDNTVDYMVVMLEDITEQKHFTIEREALNKALETKNKELESIIYVASHDLKSPLLNIQGFCEELSYCCKDIKKLLEKENVTSDDMQNAFAIMDKNIPDAMHHIVSGTEKINMILAGLLRLSRLGSVALKKEPLDIKKMVTKIIETMDFQIKEAGIKIDIGYLPQCLGDKYQINQVLSNLIDNAIKYLDKSRKPEIKISGYREDNLAVYCIADNGIGIDERYKDVIFKVFHRLEPKYSQGDGLGLTIVKRVLDRHNGNIWVESVLDKGSKFYISLTAV